MPNDVLNNPTAAPTCPWYRRFSVHALVLGSVLVISFGTYACLYIGLGWYDAGVGWTDRDLRELGIGHWMDTCPFKIYPNSLLSFASDPHHASLKIAPADVDLFLATLRAHGTDRTTPISGKLPTDDTQLYEFSTGQSFGDLWGFFIKKALVKYRLMRSFKS